MKKIKIAMIVCRLEFGGVESVILNYTSNMERDKFDFHIITQDINDEECVKLFENKGFIVHKICHKRKSVIRNVIEMWKVLKEEKYDIVHSHMTLTNFYALLLAKFSGVQVCISHSHNSLVSTNYIKKLVYSLLRFLNCICATNYFACGQDAADFLFGKKNRAKIKIFNNAIESEKYAYSITNRLKIRTKLNIENKVCIGHVGRFMNQKNQIFLIDIFEKYHKYNPNSVLLIIGDGELRPIITNYINQKQLSDSVIMTGNINNVFELYSAMDLFLLPSLFEGLPVVVIEAQASGLPCLLSDKIDERCKLTNLVKFIPIEKAEDWVNVMIDENLTQREMYLTKKIDLKGYDLKKEAKRMEELYLQCCKMR